MTTFRRPVSLKKGAMTAPEFIVRFSGISKYQRSDAPSTTDREPIPVAVPGMAASPTPSLQPATTFHAVSQPAPRPMPALRETRQEVAATPPSPTRQPSAPTRAHESVHLMISYATNADVVESEAKILGAKRDIEALKVKNQGVQRQRKKAREANEKGLEHIRAWQFAEAVQAFRTAAEADPADIEVINNLGHAYFRQGDLPRAEEWLLRTLTMAPGRSTAWADLGQAYASQGDIKKGVACFANAYRFARNQDVSRRFFQGLADDENQQAMVREAARQVLQLRLVQAQNDVPQGN
jgi:Flp pilus assembly protein TadD